MRIVSGIEQGSEEWLELRAGKVTASRFKDVMSKGRGSAPSLTRQSYMFEVLAEMLLGAQEQSFYSQDIERGHEDEEYAREMYEIQYNVNVEQVTIILADDERVAYSPDGVIGNDGLWECKSKKPKIHLPMLVDGEIPKEHVMQLQGGLWVAQRDWIDFTSYCTGLPMFTKRVYRDEKVISEIAEGVSLFLDELDEARKKVELYEVQ